MVLNGATLTDRALPATANWNTWADANINIFLTAGINRIAFNAYTGDDSDAINIDYIEIGAGSGTIGNYEAEATANTLAGTAVRTSNASASGGQFVSFVGNGAVNYAPVQQRQCADERNLSYGRILRQRRK